MKKFTTLLLSVIFVTLIAGSVQSIAADHLEPSQGIYKDEVNLNIVVTKGSNYQIYLQTVIKNGDGQLINVTESTAVGAYVPHKITDAVFDTLMGEKEIITIDNMRYEKVQYTYTPALENRFIELYPIFSEIRFELQFSVDDVASMHSKNIDSGRWQIDYCATITGHGDECIPVFQVLVPTMTLEPHDVVTHQWTILRIIN